MSVTIIDKHKIWNALYLKSRHEKKVAQLFENLGLEYYLPLIKRLSIRSDRKKWIEEPLFRGYIFVPANVQISEKVLFVPGVVAYVNYNGSHAVVKQSELQTLQTLIDKGYHIDADAGKELEIGDKITIASGPLKGMEGYILEGRGDTYFLISVESIGQMLKVKISKEVLVKN